MLKINFQKIAKKFIVYSVFLCTYVLITGQTPEEICQSVSDLNTGQYKLRLSEILVEHFSPIREKIEYFLKNREHLEQILTDGSNRAQNIAEQTMTEVRERVGLR